MRGGLTAIDTLVNYAYRYHRLWIFGCASSDRARRQLAVRHTAIAFRRNGTGLHVRRSGSTTPPLCLRGFTVNFNIVRFAVVAPFDAGVTATPEWISAFAQHVEACGFESIVVGEHTVMASRYRSRYPYDRSGRVALAADCPMRLTC